MMQTKNFSYYKFFFLIFLFFFLDQGSKYIAKSLLVEGQVVVFIPHLLEFTYIENTGISWGIFSKVSQNIRFWFLSILPLFFIIILFYYTFSSLHKFLWFQKLGWALVLGGALGNLYGRIFLGYVTDFMHFRFYSVSFFVNNLADDFISVGFFFILWKDIKQLLNNYLIKEKK